MAFIILNEQKEIIFLIMIFICVKITILQIKIQDGQVEFELNTVLRTPDQILDKGWQLTLLIPQPVDSQEMSNKTVRRAENWDCN